VVLLGLIADAHAIKGSRLHRQDTCRSLTAMACAPHLQTPVNGRFAERQLPAVLQPQQLTIIVLLQADIRTVPGQPGTGERREFMGCCTLLVARPVYTNAA
jgi:hypothetical protein